MKKPGENKKQRKAKIRSIGNSDQPTRGSTATDGRHIDVEYRDLLNSVDNLILVITSKSLTEETNKFHNKCMEYKKEREEIVEKWIQLHSVIPIQTPTIAEGITAWFKEAIGQTPEKIDKDHLLTRLTNLNINLVELLTGLDEFSKSIEANSEKDSESQASAPPSSDSSSFFEQIVGKLATLKPEIFRNDEPKKDESGLIFSGEPESREEDSIEDNSFSEFGETVLTVTNNVEDLRNQDIDEEISSLYVNIQQKIADIAVIKHDVSKIVSPQPDGLKEMISIGTQTIWLKIFNAQMEDTDKLAQQFNACDYPMEMTRNNVFEGKQVIKNQLKQHQQIFDEAYVSLDELFQKIIKSENAEVSKEETPVFVERFVSYKDMYPEKGDIEVIVEQTGTTKSDEEVNNSQDNSHSQEDDDTSEMEQQAVSDQAKLAVPSTEGPLTEEDFDLGHDVMNLFAAAAFQNAPIVLDEVESSSDDIPEVAEQTVTTESNDNNGEAGRSTADNIHSEENDEIEPAVRQQKLQVQSPEGPLSDKDDQEFPDGIFEAPAINPDTINNPRPKQPEPVKNIQDWKYSKSDFAATIFTLGLWSMIIYADEHYQSKISEKRTSQNEQMGIVMGCAFINLCFAFLPGIIAGITMSIKTNLFGFFDAPLYTGTKTPREETYEPSDAPSETESDHPEF